MDVISDISPAKVDDNRRQIDYHEHDLTEEEQKNKHVNQNFNSSRMITKGAHAIGVSVKYLQNP